MATTPISIGNIAGQSGGNITLQAGTGSSGNAGGAIHLITGSSSGDNLGGSVLINSGVDFSDEELVLGKARKVKWWHRFLCKVFGHKGVDNNDNNTTTFTFKLPGNFGEASMTYKGCKRCGVYSTVEMAEYTQLSKNEKMIKDIIV